MATKGGIHVGDVGTLFKCTFKKPDDTVFDISQAVTKKISLEKPNATSIERDGTFGSDGTDGLLNYTLVAGDIDVDGYWYIQGHVTFADGDDFHTDRVRFRVFKNNAAPAP